MCLSSGRSKGSIHNSESKWVDIAIILLLLVLDREAEMMSSRAMTMMLSLVIGRLRGPIATFQTFQVNLYPALLLPITFSILQSTQ